MKKSFIIAVLFILFFSIQPVQAKESDTELYKKGVKLDEERKSDEAVKMNTAKKNKGSDSVNEKNKKYLRFVLLLKNVKKLNPELINEHVAYMKSLNEKGVLELCGPFVDDWQGGMVIVKAANIEEAKKIAESDPFIKKGFDTYEVRQWLMGSKENDFLQ
ncbi:MAG TPA: YciI family protein [Candidatus Wallbacteria bacterium]|nr:YciI family protein [Candidatus Wallbacteria bacterium]